MVHKPFSKIRPKLAVHRLKIRLCVQSTSLTTRITAEGRSTKQVSRPKAVKQSRSEAAHHRPKAVRRSQRGSARRVCLTDHIHRVAGNRQSRRARDRGEIGVLGTISGNIGSRSIVLELFPAVLIKDFSGSAQRICS